MHQVRDNIAGSALCAQYPLARFPHMRKLKASEQSFMRRFTSGELAVDGGATLLAEGTSSAHLFTLLGGWAFRYKSLDDGRRQILNYALPGDLIGLQSGLIGNMQHSVDALTPVRLCVFDRERLPELFENHPGLSYDITWFAAREERILDEHLLSVGRRTATERTAYLIAHLHARGKAIGLFRRRKGFLPLTQQHVADTLGLSLVHTNKTLRKLSRRGMIAWKTGGCEVIDPKGLADLSGWNPADIEDRPHI